jgi:hypothetical protein
MTVEQAISMCREWIGRPHASLSTTDKAQIERLYNDVLGKHIRRCNCKNKYEDAVVEIYHYLKRGGQMREKSTYILKSGVVIQPKGSSQVYTNDNLTDEVAAAFLLERPNAAGLFVYIPQPKATTTPKQKRRK